MFSSPADTRPEAMASPGTARSGLANRVDTQPRLVSGRLGLMGAHQDRIFSRSEGDRWYARNQQRLLEFDSTHDVPLQMIDLYDLSPRRVLEIGAANGARLAAISSRWGAEAIAIEPSEAATVQGKRLFSDVRFVRGVASNLPIQALFDLVLVHFVLHWVDRSTLRASVGEIDRVVAPGGFLLLGDFLPKAPMTRAYHHLPESDVHTYKENYSLLFMERNHYELVALLTSHHASPRLTTDANEDERTGFHLLKKIRTG